MIRNSLFDIRHSGFVILFGCGQRPAWGRKLKMYMSLERNADSPHHRVSLKARLFTQSDLVAPDPSLQGCNPVNH
jgi:hypothetical protein